MQWQLILNKIQEHRRYIPEIRTWNMYRPHRMYSFERHELKSTRDRRVSRLTDLGLHYKSPEDKGYMMPALLSCYGYLEGRQYKQKMHRIKRSNIL